MYTLNVFIMHETVQVADKELSVTRYKQHPLHAFPPAFPSRTILVSRVGRQRSGIRQNRKGLGPKISPFHSSPEPEFNKCSTRVPQGRVRN